MTYKEFIVVVTGAAVRGEKSLGMRILWEKC